MPPAWRRPSKPSATVGWPPTTWARPQPAKRHDEEADADPVVAPAVVGLAEQPEGADKQHERQQQGHPAERAVDHRVDGVREPAPEPHQAKVAMKTPSARLNRAAPSRRSSGARSLTSWPIRRTPPPTRWPMPSHAPPTTRSSQGCRCSTAGSWRVRAVPPDDPARPDLVRAPEPACGLPDVPVLCRRGCLWARGKYEWPYVPRYPNSAVPGFRGFTAAVRRAVFGLRPVREPGRDARS